MCLSRVCSPGVFEPDPGNKKSCPSPKIIFVSVFVFVPCDPVAPGVFEQVPVALQDIKSLFIPVTVPLQKSSRLELHSHTDRDVIAVAAHHARTDGTVDHGLGVRHLGPWHKNMIHSRLPAVAATPLPTLILEGCVLPLLAMMMPPCVYQPSCVQHGQMRLAQILRARSPVTSAVLTVQEELTPLTGAVHVIWRDVEIAYHSEQV